MKEIKKILMVLTEEERKTLKALVEKLLKAARSDEVDESLESLKALKGILPDARIEELKEEISSKRLLTVEEIKKIRVYLGAFSTILSTIEEIEKKT